jgi:hypothetical protein
MHLIESILLICSTTLPRAECQPDTALDVIIGPKATSARLCGFQSQAFLAPTTLAATLAKGTYLKIQCKRAHATDMAAPVSPAQSVDRPK